MKEHSLQLANGVTLSVRQLASATLASINVWIAFDRHGLASQDIGLAHLVEHLISRRLRTAFGDTHQAILGATTDEALCFFGRMPVEVLPRYMGALIEALQGISDPENAAELAPLVAMETRIIERELERQAQGNFSALDTRLGIGAGHDIWRGDVQTLSVFAQGLLCGARVYAELLSCLEVAHALDVLAPLSILAPGKKTSHEPSSPLAQPTRCVDKATSTIGLRFPVATHGAREYALMLGATQFFCSSRPESLASRLRGEGLSYHLDRRFFLTGGAGEHVLYVKSTAGGLARLGMLLSEYFSTGSASTSSISTALATSSLYQKLSVENIGVLASRSGKHYLNYGAIPSLDEMINGIDRYSVSDFQAALHQNYFDQAFVELAS